MWLPVGLTLLLLQRFHFFFSLVEEYHHGGRRQEVTRIIRDISNNKGRNDCSEYCCAIRVLTKGEQMLSPLPILVGRGKGRDLRHALVYIISRKGYRHALTCRHNLGAKEVAQRSLIYHS